MTFSLNSCWPLRRSLTESNQVFHLISFIGVVTHAVTSGDLRRPGLHPLWPNAGSQEQLNTEECPSVCGTKGVSMVRSPLLSPAKRTGSTLAPLGFISLFFLDPAKSRRGRQICQVPQMERPDQCAGQIPKDLHVALSWLTLSVFISSTRHWSVASWQEGTSRKGFFKSTITRERSFTKHVIEVESRAFLHCKNWSFRKKVVSRKKCSSPKNKDFQ